ncbi:estradiol 17-beta-dehydrogenase 11-like protein [Turdus rufiventris]|nr:estradiol 17-beta-dehydrogenase 11-like protein [Turdus rufiventris]
MAAPGGGPGWGGAPGPHSPGPRTALGKVFINTGFVKNPSARLGRILEIEEVVEALMEGIVTNKKMVFVPSNQGVGLLLERVFPERAMNLLRKMCEVKFDAVIGQRSTQ